MAPVRRWVLALSALAGQSLASTATSSELPVTTTAVSGNQTPPNHWMPDRPDPYVCEYLGENNCWQPSITEVGPPYMGFSTPRPRLRKTCVVKAHNDPSKDDAPEILQTFRECRKDSHIVFANTTYHIASVMNTTGLDNVDVEVKGTLAWNNTDINYWLNNSLPIGFQNQTTAWVFGGTQVHFYGHGVGTLNGNGQVWYSYANGTGNLHGRPHAISISSSKDCVIEGLNFIKAQMWTMTVARSEQILLQDIYVNNTCEPGAGTFHNCNLNTDGCDTLYANNITFLRWTIDNGDDAISLKQNSTNIYVADSKFYNGQGIALGSVGQYPGQINVMENFTARNIYSQHTTYGAYMKTWTGLTKGYPPNGGGGGFGYAKNLTFENFVLKNTSLAWSIDQKQSYNGEKGGENTSRFQFSDISFTNIQGTIKGEEVVSFQCSEAAPCSGIVLENNHFTVQSNGTTPNVYYCSGLVDPTGFTCTAGCGADAENCIG